MHKQWNVKVLVFVLAGLSTLSAFAAGAPTAGIYENSTATPILPLIRSATRTLDIEIYTMADPIVQQAIVAAQTAGVHVRIIQEPNPIGDTCNIFMGLSTTDPAACVARKAFRAQVLKNGGIYVPFNKVLCGPATKGCVEHGKMVIVDAQAALLSTGNLDPTSVCDHAQGVTRCDRDYAYIIHYLPAIQVLGQIFERDLAGAPYDLAALLRQPGAADLTVSPFSLTPLLAMINSAKKSLVIQEQYLKDPQMNAAIIAAARAGVDVRVNVASICGFGRPTPYTLTAWNQINSGLEQAGVKIRVFTKSIAVGGVGGYLHAKAIIVDGQTAWMGSINGSTEAIGSNREFGLFFNGPTDMAYLSRFMQLDFNNPNGETWQESANCAKD